MSLTAGNRLGPYEVIAPLGAGGMGEVYRARDVRLGREVAIKVLPASFAGDPDRLRRFEQEARAASALNHPNILSVYDIGTHEGAPYVVSELLEGETLRERIGHTPLPRRKAIEYASQLARGLAAAHDKHIVHRDLKPDNVFVTRDGRAKILDFGLAKATFGTPVETATKLATGMPLTAAGTVLGTVGYMSPEQVRGLDVDYRSDIFSFGVVLYEMLTGRRAFSGGSAVETMNAILKEDPAPATDGGQPVPRALDAIVRHCLEKNPEERYQSARDIAFGLESLSGESSHDALVVPPVERRRWRRPVLVTAAVAAAGAALLWIGRLTVVPSNPTFEQVTFRRGDVSSARFAPDGRTIVYSASWDGGPREIYSTQTGSPESRPFGLQATLQAVSSKGEMAVLLARLGTAGVLARVPIGGGAPREVLEDVVSADWGPDGETLAVVRRGGERDAIEFPIGHVLYRGRGALSDITVSPKGNMVAFAQHPVLGDNRGDAVVVDLGGKATTISSGWEDIADLHWTPGGDEVWFSASAAGTNHTIFAATPAGRVRTVVSAPGGLDLADIAADGKALVANGHRRPSIVALVPGAAEERDLTWMDFSIAADIAADGTKLLFSEQGVASGPGYGVYLRGTDGAPAVRLGKGLAASLSPDQRSALAIDVVHNTLLVLPTGAGEPRSLPPASIKAYTWAGWFPDGKRIVFAGFEEGKGPRMYACDLSGNALRPLTPEGVTEHANIVTPDGQWIAARSKSQIQLFPVNGGAPRPVPGSEPADEPLGWRTDARALYVRQGVLPAKIVALDVTSGARTLLRTIAPRDTVGVRRIANILVTPDGKSYVYTYQRSLYDLYQLTGLK